MKLTADPKFILTQDKSRESSKKSFFSATLQTRDTRCELRDRVPDNLGPIHIR